MQMSLKHTLGHKCKEMQRKQDDYKYHYDCNGETKVNWKGILKKSAEQMYQTKEKTDKLLDYNPVPAEHVQKKIEYFFKPYDNRDNFLNKKIKF